MKRGLSLGLALLLLVETGCAGGMQVLTREQLVDPKPARSYRVTTRSGEEVTFIALHLEGNRLVGTTRTTTKRTVGEGEEARLAVSNRYGERSIPWTEVVRVEAERDRSTPRGGLMLATASVAVGVGLFLILGQGGGNTPASGGGGKKTP